MSTPSGHTPVRGRKLAVVGAIVALTVGASGLFMGMRQTDQSSVDLRGEWRQAAQEQEGIEAHEQAPVYADMPRSTARANANWTPHLGSLVRPAEAERYVATVLGEKDRGMLVARRASHRQYDGAPPVAPHPIDQLNPAACLQCHGSPTRIGSIDVPQMSHPLYSNCIQCHAAGAGPASWWQSRNEALSDGNSFQGRGPAGQGMRAYTGAPPAIPHTTWMRENCMSCHGPGGTVALRTSHPNRQSCTQCHAPNAALDNRMASGLPPPLPEATWRTDKNP